MKTYWHLAGARKKPSDYEIASSRLLYYPGRGFEVRMPLSGWYATHQQGSPLQCSDWDAFRDPRETTYARYVELQQTKEQFVETILESSRPPSRAWLAAAGGWPSVLRYPCHALEMVAAYVGHMAPAGRVVIACAFQAADELRRVERFAYRMRQWHDPTPAGSSGPGVQPSEARPLQAAGVGSHRMPSEARHIRELVAPAREAWQSDAAWQPLREVMERLLVTYDWGEALIALCFAVKPRFDHAFGPQLAEAARAAGDDALAHVLTSLDEDARWHRAWSAELVRHALQDCPANRAVIERWLAKWDPLAERAVAALAALPPTAATTVGEQRRAAGLL